MSKRFILLALIAVSIQAAKKPPRILTVEEKQAAYSVSVNQISAMLKAPSTAQFSAFDQAVFSTGLLNTIDVRVEVDAQNSYGAMLRNRWRCRVHPQRPDGLYRVMCFEERR